MISVIEIKMGRCLYFLEGYKSDKVNVRSNRQGQEELITVL